MHERREVANYSTALHYRYFGAILSKAGAIFGNRLHFIPINTRLESGGTPKGEVHSSNHDVIRNLPNVEAINITAENASSVNCISCEVGAREMTKGLLSVARCTLPRCRDEGRRIQFQFYLGHRADGGLDTPTSQNGTYHL